MGVIESHRNNMFLSTPERRAARHLHFLFRNSILTLETQQQRGNDKITAQAESVRVKMVNTRVESLRPHPELKRKC